MLHTSITANASSATVCPGGSVTYQYSTSSGGYCLGANTWEYQWENTSGGVVRSWSTTANFTTTLTSSTTYRLRMRCSGCTSSTFLSNDVTVNVYSVSSTTPTLSSPANNSNVLNPSVSLTWSGSLGNHPSSRYEVQVNGGAWTSTGTTASYSATLNVGANTWRVRYYDGCSGLYYTTSSNTIYYTPNNYCGNIDHGGNNWTISTNTTVSGNHINIGTFTINNGITATVDATCHYFNVEANVVQVIGNINGDGAGNIGGTGGAGGIEAFNSPDNYCNGGYGGKGGLAGQGTGGGNAGSNGGNATCIDQICGGFFCSGNKDGHDGGGAGGAGGAGGSYGGQGASGAISASGSTGGGATGGTYALGGSVASTYGTSSGTDINWGSGGGGAGGGGGAWNNGNPGGNGGAGGGQVSLKAASTLTLSGTISCNGNNGSAGGNASGNSTDNAYDCTASGYNGCSICPQESYDYAGGAGGGAGGGSGGGILIQSCGTMSFTGNLSANGGAGGGAALPNTNYGACFDWARGGAGGGGGRIKIFRNPCESNTITGTTNCSGGAGGASSDGHIGNSGNAGTTQTALNHPSYQALNAGSIGSAQTVCTGADLAAFTNTVSPSGGNCAQTYTYQWMKCTSGCGSAPTNYTDIAGANSIAFNEGIITQTTYYVRKVTSGNCTAYTPSVIATVVPDPVAPTATKSPNTASVCEGQVLTLINPTDNGGGTGSCQINYRSSTTIAGLASAGWSTTIPSTTAVPGNFYIEMQKVCSGSGCDVSPITQYSWIVNSNSIAPTSITGTSTICSGNSTSLTVNGGSLGTGASWKWYSGSCGGTSVGTGTSITVSPTTNTTYYVRAEGTCNNTACVSYNVTVNSLSTNATNITVTNNNTCNTTSKTLTLVGGSLGTGASWKWYSGSCGGVYEGTGTSISVNPSSTTTYYVRAEGTCNTSTCASVVVTVLSAPTNDLCVNATSIGSLPYSSGLQTNICATNDSPPVGASSCGNHDNNVWYKFIGTGNQINISTCDITTNFDTELHLYTGSCGSFTEVNCNDDGFDIGCNSGKSSLTFCSTNGVTYYISLGSYQLSGATGNYTLTVSEKNIGPATITPSNNCGDGSVTLSANVGLNADVVEFSIDGGTTIAFSDATIPYQYTTSTYTAPNAITVHVRSKNSSTGCVGSWTNSVIANFYQLPSLTVQPLCNNPTARRIELFASGGSNIYTNFEQQSPSVSHASNIFAVPFNTSRNFRVTDSRGCSSTWLNYTSPTGPSQISGVANGNCIVRGQNDWWHITDVSNQVILSIQDNSNNLGAVNAWSYIEPSTTYYNSTYYLKRHFKITSENAPTTNVKARFYFTDTELNELIVNSKLNQNSTDDVNGLSDLKVTRYSGINEDNSYSNNDFGCTPCFTVYSPTTGSATDLGIETKYVEVTMSGFSEDWIHGGVNTSSILPIELVSLDVQCIKNDALIRWVTASEINNSHFIIERSTDGIHYTSITQIPGSGNSNNWIEYSYIDDQKPNGIVYYRLTQVDFDGTTHVFEPKSLACDMNTKLQVIPNPFTDKISILGLSNEDVIIEIFNGNGAKIYNHSINQSTSSNLDMSFLKPGIYLLKILDKKGKSEQFKLIRN